MLCQADAGSFGRQVHGVVADSSLPYSVASDGRAGSRNNSFNFQPPCSTRMLTTTFLNSMSRSGARATQRTRALAHHMMSTAARSEVCNGARVCCSLTHSHAPLHRQPKVLFESNLATRLYALNRPDKLNALDENMLSLLRPKIEVPVNSPAYKPLDKHSLKEWNASDLCRTIVGTGIGKAFCVGGDVSSE